METNSSRREKAKRTKRNFERQKVLWVRHRKNIDRKKKSFTVVTFVLAWRSCHSSNPAVQRFFFFLSFKNGILSKRLKEKRKGKENRKGNGKTRTFLPSKRRNNSKLSKPSPPRITKLAIQQQLIFRSNRTSRKSFLKNLSQRTI